MPKRTNSIAIRTIGIDTGKNTLHMIGLDEKGVIILRKSLQEPYRCTTCEYAAMPSRDRSRHGHSLHGP